MSITESDETILDRAEVEKDNDIQLYLILFVETLIETEAIFIDNHLLYISYEIKDFNAIAKRLDKYRCALENNGIDHNLPEATENYVKDLLEPKKMDDSFDKLIDEFIANELKKLEEQQEE